MTKIDSLLSTVIYESPIPASAMKYYINKEVYIYDEVFAQKVVNDTLKLLYVGGKHLNKKATIFVKGKRLNQNVEFNIGHKWYFTGQVFIYRGKPAIIITDESQLSRHVQI